MNEALCLALAFESKAGSSLTSENATILFYQHKQISGVKGCMKSMQVGGLQTLKVMLSASSIVWRSSMAMPCWPMVYLISRMMHLRAASMPRQLAASRT